MKKARNRALPDKITATAHGTVREILEHKGRGLHTIGPEATVYDAVAAMDEWSVGALPVVSEGKLVGIISERDYTRKIILHGRASKETPVSEIMTARVVTVAPDNTLGECLELVTLHGMRHLPVVENGKLAGILSIGDLVRAILEQQADRIENLHTFIGQDYPK